MLRTLYFSGKIYINAWRIYLSDTINKITKRNQEQ